MMKKKKFISLTIYTNDYTNLLKDIGIIISTYTGNKSIHIHIYQGNEKTQSFIVLFILGLKT